ISLIGVRGSACTRETSRATPHKRPRSSMQCTLVSASGCRFAESATATSASLTMASQSTARKSTPISPPALVGLKPISVSTLVRCPCGSRSDLLPQGQRTKVLTLMGFNPTSAGGLMGVDFLAVDCDAMVSEALVAVALSANLQPEALTSVHCIDDR